MREERRISEGGKEESEGGKKESEGGKEGKRGKKEDVESPAVLLQIFDSIK